MAGTFARWTKEGQLATFAMFIVFVTWLCFQIFVAPLDRPTVLNEMLMTMAGIWMGNIMFAQGKKDDAVAARLTEGESRSAQLEKDMATEQKRSTGTEKRARESQAREYEPSLHDEGE